MLIRGNSCRKIPARKKATAGQVRLQTVIRAQRLLRVVRENLSLPGLAGTGCKENKHKGSGEFTQEPHSFEADCHISFTLPLPLLFGASGLVILKPLSIDAGAAALFGTNLTAEFLAGPLQLAGGVMNRFPEDIPAYSHNEMIINMELNRISMNRHIAIAASLLALALLAAGCVTGRMRHISDPGEFGRNLFRIADGGTAREWGTQLTEDRRAMGDEYITSHFTRWKSSLIQLKPAFGVPLEQVPFRIAEGNALEFEADKKWHLIFRVKMEDGGWKINQD